MNWYDGSIVEAINLSKSRGAIFVVYVEGNDDTSLEMTGLLNKPDVYSRLNVPDNFVAIKLASGSQAYTQFAQIYQFVPVPSIFFIGNNGTPLEVVAGSTTGGVTGLCTRIDALLDKKDGGPGPTLLSKANSPSSSQATTSSFIAAEQKQASMNTSSSGPKARPASAEYELVCEGEVCIRRPKQTVIQSSPEGDGSASSVQTPNTAAPAGSSSVPSTGNVESPAPATSQEVSNIATTENPTEISMEEKLERAKELLEKKRRDKLEEERRLEKEKELERRSQGQGVAELKRWQQEQELKNIQEERKREKRENEKARQRILEQIAQDRADRQARFAQPEAPLPAPPATVQPPSPSTDTSNITRIQFKMPDGSAHVTQIESDATLAELREYVKKNLQTSGNFTLSTVYPRRCLQVEEDDKTMRELGLSPSCALLVLRGENVSNVVTGGNTPYPVANSSGFFGMLSHIFWSFIIAPVQGLFSYVSSLITGQRPATGPTRDSQPGVPTQNRRPQSQSDSNVKRRKISGGEGSGSKGVRREGNTYRLRDPRDSDDENNTWNGNSTQQM